MAIKSSLLITKANCVRLNLNSCPVEQPKRCFPGPAASRLGFCTGLGLWTPHHHHHHLPQASLGTLCIINHLPQGDSKLGQGQVLGHQKFGPVQGGQGFLLLVAFHNHLQWGEDAGASSGDIFWDAGDTGTGRLWDHSGRGIPSKAENGAIKSLAKTLTARLSASAATKKAGCSPYRDLVGVFYPYLRHFVHPGSCGREREEQ